MSNKHPQSLNQFLSSIRMLIDQGQHKQARKHLLGALTINHEHPELLLWLGIVEQISGNLPAAFNCLQQANQRKPGNADCLMQLGQVLKRLQRNDEALECLQQALSLRYELPGARLLIANLLSKRKEFSAAIVLLREELALRADNLEAHTALAQIFERMNRLEEAALAAHTALKIQPGQAPATLILAHVERRLENYAAAEQLYRRILGASGIDSNLVRAHLAHVLDRQGKYTEAFEQSAICMESWKQDAVSRNLLPQTYFAMLDDCSNWLENQPQKTWPKIDMQTDSHSAPIFFVGFPRSGTTLVEQILRQHPRLISTGESAVLETLLAKIPQKSKQPKRFPASLDDLDADDMLKLRKAYFEQVTKLNIELTDDQILVDKLPLNIALLPLVARIFPDAQVLVALRDPRDVCLSCFMQSFSLNTAMVCFLDLQTTAQAYARVMGLWQHYKQQLGLHWHEYRYEDLVENFAAITQGIFDFLELDYPENAVDYYRATTDNALITPSYQDVAKPVYQRATARWRNYQSQLETITPLLAPFIEAFGYSYD